MARLAPAARDVPGLLRALRADVGRHDLMLYAAGLAFYAGLAAVPLLLVGLDVAGAVLGERTVQRLGRTLAERAPQALGFDDQLRRLAELGSSLGLVSLVAAVLVGSTYGEGLLRAFDRLSPAPDRPARALLGRLRAVALLAVLPLAVIAGLATAAALTRSVGEGLGATLLGVWLAFVAGWLVSSAVLGLVYRTFAPERPGRRALVWGSLATGSFLTGMTEGWVLLLGLDVDLGRAYGGSTGIAAAAAFLAWLFLVQYVLLVGLLLVRRLTVLFGR